MQRSHVKLNNKKINFLNCNWPYIYTFNIDDGIEKNSNFKNKILPYLEIDKNFANSSCVFKLHGDVQHELDYITEKSIIFSSSQYLDSLIDNKSMLNSFKSDFQSFNTIYIGCSLENELDIAFALRNTKKGDNKSIFITSAEPDFVKKEKLKKYGITDVLIVDDYDQFYEKFALLNNTDKLNEELQSLYIFNNQFNYLQKDTSENYEFLTQFKQKDNSGRILIPNYFTARDCTNAIFERLNNNQSVIIKGRRFSGKSFVIYDLLKRFTNKIIYFFNSKGTTTYEDLNFILNQSNNENLIIFFDSNSLNIGSIRFIHKNYREFQKKNILFVFCLNNAESENYAEVRKLIDVENEYEINPKFSHNELLAVNEKLNSLGMMKFEANQTILNNSARILFTMKDIFPNKKEKYNIELSENLISSDDYTKALKILIILFVNDKIYSELANIIGFDLYDLNAFTKKLEPYLELDETKITEAINNHSRYKIIINSKLFIRKIIFEIHKSSNKDSNYVVNAISDLVSVLNAMPNYRQIARNIAVFDSINDILTDMDKLSEQNPTSGFRPTVMKIYKKFYEIDVQKNWPDFWLQYAKAHNKVSKEISDLREGIAYGLKAYDEAIRSTTKENAIFTIALIHGKICNIENYKIVQNNCDAILWFYRALVDAKKNDVYINQIVKDRRSSLHILMNNIRHQLTDPRYLEVRNEYKYLSDFVLR